MKTEKQKVLIVGATGYLGQHVVKAMKAAGYWVRALSRSEARIAPVRPYIDDLVIGEATAPDSIADICRDIDIVFSSLGITRQKDGLTYMDVDYQANKNILDLALAADVERFMYISALHADKLRHVKILAAKERFADELKGANITHTIMRPNGFFSDMTAFLDMARNGRVYLFGSGSNRANPIHGADLAQACVEYLDQPGGEYDIGGPELLTQNEIAQQAFAAAGVPEGHPCAFVGQGCHCLLGQNVHTGQNLRADGVLHDCSGHGDGCPHLRAQNPARTFC